MAIDPSIGATTLLPLGELNTPLRERVRAAPPPSQPRNISDEVSLSSRARELIANETDAARQSAAASNDPTELSDQEQAVVAALKRRDAEVRRHERAHQTAGGGLVGPATFQFQRGPDGKLYAIGGEVSIDSSPAPTPEATIAKMAAVIRAALAPVSPSTADRQVAAQARANQIEAQQQLAEQRTEEAAQAQRASEERAERLGIEEPGGRDDLRRANEAYSQVNETIQTALGGSEGRAALFSLNA